jgi:hypothetical protein
MIADAHISRTQGNVEAFFEMLAALEDGPSDVVFLGDIFDLWVALPRYENEQHRMFLSWCQRQKGHRRIGFVEGNHEFFLRRVTPRPSRGAPIFPGGGMPRGISSAMAIASTAMIGIISFSGNLPKTRLPKPSHGDCRGAPAWCSTSGVA